MKTFLKYSLPSLILLLFMATSCQKEEVTEGEIIEKAAKVKEDRTRPTKGEPKVGDNVGDLNHGGIIFWVDPYDSTHGLVCALSDIVIDNGLKGKKRTITRSWPWGCEGTFIDGATQEGIGTGQQNTEKILDGGCNIDGTAAYLCANYNGDNYEDWFLPSYKELELMYIELYKKTTYGKFSPGKYWSSTQVSGITYNRERYGELSIAGMLDSAAVCLWDGNLITDNEDLGYFFAKGIDFGYGGTDFLDVPCPIWRTKSSTRGVRPVREYGKK